MPNPGRFYNQRIPGFLPGPVIIHMSRSASPNTGFNPIKQSIRPFQPYQKSPAGFFCSGPVTCWTGVGLGTIF